MLIVFGGLPGTGKTTIARRLASRRAATYLRIDTIEQAIRDSLSASTPIGPAGYAVANALAEANLAFGRCVVADCVNPVAESRDAWRRVAASASVRILEVELICSDPIEHRRRVEGRTPDIPGLTPPSWRAVRDRDYQPWTGPHLVIDTARISPDEAVATVLGQLDASA